MCHRIARRSNSGDGAPDIFRTSSDCAALRSRRPWKREWDESDLKPHPGCFLTGGVSESREQLSGRENSPHFHLLAVFNLALQNQSLMCFLAGHNLVAFYHFQLLCSCKIAFKRLEVASASDLQKSLKLLWWYCLHKEVTLTFNLRRSRFKAEYQRLKSKWLRSRVEIHISEFKKLL